MSKFIRIHNHVINVDWIAYVDFLDSGRAMIFMSGLSMEKQNVAVEPDEARRLAAFLAAEHTEMPPAPAQVPAPTYTLQPLRR